MYNQNFTTMWTRSHSVITRAVTKEQLWKLFENVNAWHTWDEGVEYAKMDGEFKKGNTFVLKPKKGPKVKIELVDTVKNKTFTDMTKFPLAKMYGEHVFEDTPEGLKITTTMKVIGPLAFLWRKIVAQDIVNALPKEMEHQIKTARNL